VLDAFATAAVEAGLPRTADFNGGNNEGVGYFEVNQRRGVRWNTAKAFLRPVQQRQNLTVWTNAQVQSLDLTPGQTSPWRVQGVSVQRRGDPQPVTVTARREVVLTAGAVATPQLLERSGIGASATLSQVGIQPRHALPGVGENLQDHLQIRAVFGVQGVKTLNVLAASWWGKASIGLEYLLKRSGPMSMAPSQLGAFAKSSADRVWPNLQYHVQPLSLDAFGEPLHPYPAFTASVCNLNPSSRGSVHLRSPRADDAPVIQPNYLATDDDRHIAAQSLRLTRRIAAQPALARYQPQEIKPGVVYQSDEALARLAGDIGTTIFHPVGTCRMGRSDDAQAVVDSQLRVLGVEGLRVADASVMPTITSGNTNAPTLMIAERAAALIRAAWP
jgi:choline dehydrogenase